MQKQEKAPIIIAILLVLAAAFAKVATYPHTFDPIIGMALFSGAVIKDKKLAFLLPLFAMLLSDLILEMSGIAQGFYGPGQLVNYGILLLITIFGFRLKKINVVNVVGFSLISSVIFYIVSNLGFFLIDNRTYHLYPNTLDGLATCYVKALPFLKWYVDLAFSVILFGSYSWITTYFIKDHKATA